MRVVLQKVKQASVTAGDYFQSIDQGYCLLVGIGQNTTEKDLNAVAKKIANTRIFEDEHGKMNLSINDVGGKILSISQFTLYANVKKGNRPSFTDAKTPEIAKEMYEKFNEILKGHQLEVFPGVFGEMLEISLINDGPVTIIFESVEGKIQ
ncbi:D-aminoacyl-tRNA deacylase [Macrococcoides goetzii]|uniref:D-aminoacyl-tRNA deacylase n=1 Tax=Macrococcus TaxID=69965 RepID=UPI001EF35C6B|nr:MULTISPECIES: D-aminoacyl-tRNA deacylase [Macrococcus]MCG7420162.1 D-aminoacyl-tRNA deacylase [Macrococcus epidermidis]MCH4984124.1 D-tyrosyl-tRNA(Tyr) deacylase [Macrococcus sp. PK]